MSAVVIVSAYYGRTVEVPRADSHSIDSEGRLSLGTAYTTLAVFEKGQWEYFVITPERGADGRFVKRGQS